MPLSKYRVVDVMQREVATADAADPARRLFSEIGEATHGCFVIVDEHQHTVGIITEGDVIRMVLSEQVPGGQHLSAITTSIDSVLRHFETIKRARGDTVSDCMTSPVVTVDETDTLQRVAEIFAENHFRLLPVVRGDRLVGVIRHVDLLGPIVQVHDEAQEAREATESSEGERP